MTQNSMRQVVIEKITLNVGAGKDQKKLEKGLKLLKNITGLNPIKTITALRLATWGIRPGLPIGCKLTVRKQKAQEILKRLLAAKDYRLNPKQFDNNGNISFGINEYIDIPDVRYEPDIGIMGLEVCVTFQRPGFRIKRRRLLKRKIPGRHRVTKNEAMDFMTKHFGVSMGSED